MSGYKTKLAAALAIVYGVVGLFLGLHDSDACMQFVINGLGLIGIGHKIEKAANNAN